MIKNDGITLIALIITIIIILILSTVTISALTGDNGIITKATQVELKYSKGEIKEALSLEINAQLVEASSHISGTTEDISKYFNEESMINYLQNTLQCITPETELESDKVIPVLSDEAILYKRYIITPTVLASSVDTYGKGNVDASDPDKLYDLFVLEVEYDETNKSTGKYELKYYDLDGESELIDTYNFYITNQG
jgi:hypothetical protein